MARIEPWQGVLAVVGLALLAWVVVAPAPQPLVLPEGGTTTTTTTGTATTVDVDTSALDAPPGQMVTLNLAGRQAQLWQVGSAPPHYQGVVLPEGAPIAVTVLPNGVQGFALLPDGTYVFEPAGPGKASVRVVSA